MTRFALLLAILLITTASALAAPFDFYRLSGENPGPTLLIIGGIDGDEPGGFHAAATLLSRYKINRGQLWVVPNLNLNGIIKRQRGRLNLKFASVAKNDPDYAAVTSIQQIVKHPQVDLILNLHDGSGYYHPHRINSLRNPGRWGQSCVIDASTVATKRFGRLQELTTQVIARDNSFISDNDQRFRLKHVHTDRAETGIAARKSLSYFAVRNDKPAVAIEASKSHPVHRRTFYHLLLLEQFMSEAGMTFSRDFDLTSDGVQQVIRGDARISLADGRIQLELNNMRPALKHFPLPRGQSPQFNADNPLVLLRPEGNRYRIHYGNNRYALISPHFYPLDESLDRVRIQVDGQTRNVPFGSIIPVGRRFQIELLDGYRTNVVGFARKGINDDAGVTISFDQLIRSYSIDKAGQLYRVEVYRDDRFCGMVLADFRPDSQKKEPLVAQTAQTKAMSNIKSDISN